MPNKTSKVVERKYLFPFILITSLFALWGFANDITNPMVAAFQTVMEISAGRASLIQFAFYGGYATMAIPAALFIQKYSYKSGVLMGLGLYAVGALLFWPAAQYQIFEFFLLSLYILTFGLAFLETTANPLILSLGSKETSTRRLNLAQAFNPMGSLMGMFVASQVVLTALQSEIRNADGTLVFSALSAADKAAIRTHDLLVIRDPYIAIGLVVVIMFVVIACAKIPQIGGGEKITFVASCKRLYANKIYRYGVVAQIFYVAAQIMCWTFIIQYADRLGIDKATAQMYNIFAMLMFLCGRFVSTFLMRYVNSRMMLMIFACCAAVTITLTIVLTNIVGLYCLMLTSLFMSLMFPTIYGIALENVDKDTTIGAAFLVMAIVGGALMPPLQGNIIDLKEIASFPAVNLSFVLPLICFIAIAMYGYSSYKDYKRNRKTTI